MSLAASRNLIGKRFNKLVVVDRDGNYSYRSGAIIPAWICQCDCGNTIRASYTKLSNNITKSCKACALHIHRDRGVNPAFNALYGRYRKRGYDKHGCFELSVDQFKYLTSSVCHYCGAEPNQKVQHSSKIIESSNYTYNGIDRLDPKNPYRMDNVVTCCGRCNEAKNDLTESEFYDWIRRVIAQNPERFEAKDLCKL